MQVINKELFISLRVKGDLFQALKDVDNRSEFIRNAIALALAQQKTA